MKHERYKLSFTTGSLYLQESAKIAADYLELQDWDAVKERVMAENVLQSRTRSSAARLYRELVPRLRMLSQEQLALFVDGSLREQKQLLWLAICKRYRFIQEFAVEVLREKFLVMDYDLSEADYDAFFNRKADWHAELDEITETTRKKIKQVLLRMLKEAELISSEGVILPAILSARLAEALKPDAPLAFQIYPVMVTDIPGVSENA